MPRLIYIHGYVEDPSIFDNLAPLLSAESVLKLNLQDEFARWNPDDKTVNVSTLAQYLAKAYQIGPDDVVIGHSMGGWIAANLKAQTGCRAVLIASYTDQKKLITFTHNIQVVRLLVKLGLVQSQWFAKFALKKYPFDESRTLHKALINAMASQPRRYVYQQLRVLLAPYPTPPATPDIRIHSQPDSIVRHPDETYVDTPGDHFNLVFYPHLVAAPILTWLKKSKS
ncbi:MAG: alpha/beta hydrolase [Cytophagaceae bacterium]|nr:MAG: alpha/beta hydrolase [Cytophagaceae bacterium]